MKTTMNEPRDICGLEEKIGYTFKNKEFLKTALTRSSFANDLKAHHIQSECNERLEFLGDSVLSFITADYIYNFYKKLPEGQLTKLRAAVVCETALFEYAKQLEIGLYLLIGKAETDGRQRRSTLADAFEAILAAIYLDSGSLDKARDFALPFIIKNCEEVLKSGIYEDNKSRLQTFIQQNPGDILEYKLLEEKGPPHDRMFSAAVFLNSNKIGSGTGRTKRAAEQAAAREALNLFGEFSVSNT